MSAEGFGGAFPKRSCDENSASDINFIKLNQFYRSMDVVNAKINQILGVYPDDLERRASIAIFVAIIGAIFVLLGLYYTFSSFSATILLGEIKQVTYASKNIGYFLMVVYALFMASLLYYIFLPWKSKKRIY